MAWDQVLIDANPIFHSLARRVNTLNSNPSWPVKCVVNMSLEKVTCDLGTTTRRVKDSPQTEVVISLDGTPPLAKLDLQRMRRSRRMLSKTAMDPLRQLVQEDSFRPLCGSHFTPGTKFMEEAGKMIGERAGSRFRESKGPLSSSKVMIDDSHNPGEGEIKLRSHMRGDRILVYGSEDADLFCKLA